MSEVISIATGDRRVTRQIVVNAPVGQLFALVSDPHRHGELDGSGTVKDTVDGPAKLFSGAKFSVKMKQFGIPYKITSRVVDYAEGSVIAWKHPMGHIWIWEFEELATGRTQVRETFEYSTSKFPKLLEVTGIPKKNGTGISKTLQALNARFS